jgi:molybdate transport system ATP-binding protein
MSSNHPFITLDRVTVRLPNRLILEDTSWEIHADEHWAVLGPNGSGKTTLVRALWGGVPLRTGSIRFAFPGAPSVNSGVLPREAIGNVSLEMHQKLLEQEEAKEEFSSFACQSGEGTTAREVIFSGILNDRSVLPSDETKLADIAGRLEIGNLLFRSVRSLSTGELRKVLIARALMKSPRLLILDEPFEGLDEKGRELLARSIEQLMAGPLRVILVAHHLEEIVSPVTHVLLVKDGQVFRQGPKEEVLTSQNLTRLYGCELLLGKNNGTYSVSYAPELDREIELPRECQEVLPESEEGLVEMEDTTVKYGEVVVLDRLNWSMKRGENWAILGPNGAGKSTIVKLILGENLQAYANRIFLFGKRKGSGETIWEIKKRIGFVSAELQAQYRKKMDSYEVIASGFQDSIGLYRAPSREEREAVDRWVDLLEVKDLAKQPFHQLSFGQRRMVLLARAMVKSPLLLIADEPCHGLDVANRRRILKILERIGRTKTSLLYITDRREEILDCITHLLRLDGGKRIFAGAKDEGLRKQGV